MGSLWRDFVHGCRRLRRAPGFTGVAVATLALGIGATTAVFSHVNSVLFKTVPVPAGDRVGAVVMTTHGRYSDPGLLEEQLRRLRSYELSQVEAIGSVFSFRTVLTGSEHAQVVSVEAVTGNYFGLLEVRPRLGRLLMPSDDDGGSGRAVVISEHLWRTWFAAEPGIVGRDVSLAGRAFTVVGVAPASFRGIMFPNIFGHDIWAPRSAATAFGKVIQDATLCGVVARLKPGVDLRRADAELRVVGRQLEPNMPEIGLALRPLQGTLVAPVQLVQIGAGILALASLVFLISCANLTNLLLARATTRASEIAVRLANGASRRRIIQMLVMEASITCALGGAAGLGIAWLVATVFGAVMLPMVRGAVLRYDAAPNGHVVAFACLATAVAAAIVGLASTRQTAMRDPVTALSSCGSLGGATSSRSRLRTGLVVAQISASVVLLVTAGLFLRTALAALTYDPGFDTFHTAVGHMNLGLTRYDPEEGRAVFRTVLDTARGLPNVTHAALTSGLPVERSGYSLPILAEGQRVGLLSRGLYCRRLSVSPGFFDAIRLPLRLGRDFTAGDLSGTPKVVIVNQSVAAALWPAQNPIGKRLHSRDRRGNGPLLEVVGVVADTRQMSARPEERRFVFVPVEQEYAPQLALVIRGLTPPATLLRSLWTAMRQKHPDVPLFDVRTVAEEVGLKMALFRTTAIGLSALGALALLLAVIGVYGVMAYVVSLRTREFGLRQALGATSADLYNLVAGQGLRILVIGVVPGLAIALAVPWLISRFLVGVEPPHDWLTFLVVPVGLVLVGIAACLVPARRAARVDANVALRDV